MGQFAYFAENSVRADGNTPSGWVFGWLYPGDSDNNPYPTSPISGGNIPGVPWPLNWPIVATANTLVNVDAPATVLLSDHTVAVESWLTIGGSEIAASIYNHHLLQVTLTEAGVTRKLKKTGGAAYTDAIFYQITAYAGNRYGFDVTIDCDPTNWADLDLIDIQVQLVTAVVNPSGTDEWQVVT